jgi:hypothetical protein
VPLVVPPRYAGGQPMTIALPSALLDCTAYNTRRS